MEFNFLPSSSEIVLQIVAMCLTALFLPRLTVSSLFGPVLAVVALAFVNATYWESSLFNMIPETLNMRVILLLVMNAVIFFVVVKIVPGIEIDGILPAVIAPLLFSIITIVLQNYAPEISIKDIFVFLASALSGIKEYFMSAEVKDEVSFLFNF